MHKRVHGGDPTLVGVVTNKPPCIQALQVFAVVGDNTNNGEKDNHLVILSDSEGSISELCINESIAGNRCFTMFSMTKGVK